jgi:hypothetical protein
MVDCERADQPQAALRIGKMPPVRHDCDVERGRDAGCGLPRRCCALVKVGGPVAAPLGMAMARFAAFSSVRILGGGERLFRLAQPLAPVVQVRQDRACGHGLSEGNR